jgi:NADH:ubiquinone oxidoreductase subunit F (NADH-binding)/NADH:ubiquinone oxidoreductase subunit E
VSSVSSQKLHILSDERRTYGVFDELRKIQDKFGYLPPEQMKRLADARHLDLRDLHSIATFYPHFHMEAPKRANVGFCDDMTCHLRGAGDLRRKIESQFRGADSKEITFRTVSCLGRCDAAPALAINGEIFDAVDSEEITELVHKCLGGIPVHGTLPPLHNHRPASDPYVGQTPYGFLRGLVESRDFTGVIHTLKASGLKGMGGAGFPVGQKWEFVHNVIGDEKFVVCNADESEPGTIKDRFILMHMPEVLIEGLIVAGLVVGAKRGWIYVRHEYEHAARMLEDEIAACYEQKLLGKNILGSDLTFDLEVFLSPGGYICGEASAMLEAIEGKRAEPRDKPPQTGTHGLWHLPTLVNNVESFTNAIGILVRGVDWYKSQGKNGAVGLKFIGITGDVNTPGVYEVPMGTTYRELIQTYGGGVIDNKALLGFAPSGPSSGYLPAAMADLPMDWQPLSKAGSMVGSAAIVICAEGRCMLDMAFNCIRFFRNESCGKCVPCRIGTQKMTAMLEGWMRGKFRSGDMELINELSDAMKTASICGLGQIAPVPVLSVIKHFPQQIEEHLNLRHCSANVCFKD